jgi:diguanylate cyclase (GGDEF)-like protein/PAS domain S-box-containing protein
MAWTMKTIVDDAPDGIVVLSAEGTVRYANRASSRLFRCEHDHLLGHCFGFPIIAGEATDIEIPHGDGTWGIAEMRVAQTEWEGTGAYVAMLSDVTARKRAEKQMLLADKVFQNTQEGIVVTDADGVIVSVNPAFTAVTGYSPDEVLGRNPKLLKSGRHDAAFYHAMWTEIARNGQWQGEIWNRRRNGEIYPEWMNISAVQGHDGEPVYYVAVFSDISIVKQNEERLHRLAHYDALTALPNRVLFADRLRQALVQAQRAETLVGLLFLDLDRFKLVNDTLGHRAGDQLLQEVARRLQAAVRAQDTVSRLGGDEFTVILPDLRSAAGAANVADKIIEALAMPFVIQHQDVFITPSIGIALYPQTGGEAETLVKHADMAMYQAKEQGRNNYQFFRHGHDTASRDIFELEHGLRHALERGEFHLVYQPEIEIETGRVVTVEALLRWRHPTRGDIPPAEFIPVAEDSGLIGAIGEWVLREACTEAKRWQDVGLAPVRIAVNLSVRQLRNVRFAETVAEILDDTGLAAEWLEVELTESMLMQHAQDMLGILWQLRSIGVRLSIDDFGTGYSSLNYLKRLPVDTLKIDRSFIEGLGSDLNDQAISNAIIALANSLKLRVVAEGVETEEQLWFLREHSCCDAQGFFFSRPVDGEQLAGLLRNRRH